MRRREFVTLAGGAAAAWPVAARGQQAGKVWRIGFVLGAAPPSTFGLGYLGKFAEGMRELGYSEGRDFVIEWRTAEGDYDRFPAIATDLVQRKVDAIILGATAAMPAVRQATDSIPIIMTNATDPVGQGFVASLARPTGNITGLASSTDDSAPKQVELLTAAIPGLSHIGLLSNPGTGTLTPFVQSTREAAQRANLTTEQVDARNMEELEAAIARLAATGLKAFLTAADAFFFVHRQELAALALKYRMASMFPQREYVEAGGLMSYGEALGDFYRRTALYVHKIMRGAKPADLPIEQPTRFHLVINRKTTEALGITIPALLYIFADEIIE